MFDDNHIDDSDLRLKTILKNGQEDVPAHIWDGVADGLDKVAGRRKTMLWIRRTAVSIAAAAAIAVGIILNHEDATEQLVPQPQEGMIAVVETTPVEEPAEPVITAGHTAAATQRTAENTAEAIVEKVSEDTAEEPAETIVESTAENTVETRHKETDSKRNSISVMTEEISGNVLPKRYISRAKVSFTLSGIAGTNNPQRSMDHGPMRSPAIHLPYNKTTIEQTSTETVYGIPLSFGVGMKIAFSNRWAAGIGLNYSLLTSIFDGKYIEVNENGVEQFPVYADVRNFQHYIGIPLNAYYTIISRDFINLYTYAGGTFEKCVMNSYEVLSEPVIHHNESVKGIQMSVNAGIGVEFRLGKHLGLYLDPSLRYYFYNGQPRSIRTAQPLMLGFELGLRFNL